MRITLVSLLLCLGTMGMAQQRDSVIVLPDSVAISMADSLHPSRSFSLRRFFTADYPKPGRAALLSLILPGAGQAYNKRWWKLPIVYGALGGVLYVEIDNIRQYRALRDNYRLLVDGDPNTNPTEAPYDRIDATTMKSYRDQWRRYVEQTSLVLGLVYLLQVTDAFVDAHLRNFDVSDDLTLRFQPKLDQTQGLGPAFGFGISLGFGERGRQPAKLFSTP